MSIGEYIPLLSAWAKKKFGKPNKYGRIVYGWSQYGEEDDRAGIYQTNYPGGKRATILQKFYWPSNQTQPNKTVFQNLFAAALEAWVNLSQAEKDYYDLKARRKSMYGRGLYTSLWLKTHKAASFYGAREYATMQYGRE